VSSEEREPEDHDHLDRRRPVASAVRAVAAKDGAGHARETEREEHQAHALDARANNVTIKMVCEGGRILKLEVSDDGVGFETGGEFPGHLGLRSMRERAQRLGGTLTVESDPGKGTTVRAHVPLRPADTGA
jgi:nitrate/nitrite-specific signal transduction histidine kinase